MYIKQIYTDCLSQASYYIESKNESVIIDPIRDIDYYDHLLNKRNSKLKYVLESHFHARSFTTRVFNYCPDRRF